MRPAYEQRTAAGKDDREPKAGLLVLTQIRATWRPFHRLRRGIGPGLLARVLLFSAAITLILTLFQLYFDYRYEVRVIESRMSEIEGSYLQSLGEGLWNLDSRQLELQIEGILRLPAIRFVEVRETTDRADPMVVRGGRRQDHAAVRREFSLFNTSRGEPQQVGVLSIEATFDEVYRALLHKAIVISISQGATIFLVSFFILFITHRLVTRHLTALAGFLGRYDLRRPPPPLRLQRRAPKEPDELDQVIAAFETMRQSLERAYADLRESEQRFRDYAETASDWFWATGPEHDFTYFSERVGFGIDWGKLIGKRRWDVAADFASEPEKWREHMAALERCEPFRDFVYKVRRVDGSLGFVSISGKPVFDAERRFAGYRGVARDITERQQAEEALRQAQAELAHVARLTTLGELTASIAHEINQPLGAVVNNASACVRWLAAQNLEEARQSAMRVVADGHRAGDIITRIRNLAKKEPLQKDWLDLNATIRDVLALARSEVQRHGIALETHLAGDMPLILGDRIQVQQVLLNLLMNAIEALSGVGAGPRALWVSSELVAATEVVIAVRDSGPGLDPQSLDRLFEAFYTTKPHGLGLGLAISRSIIAAHGGRLWATVNVPHGAVLQFTLPIGREGVG
jgi:PAS domain S-box-containing protein